MTGQEAVEDFFYDFCFFRYYFRLTVASSFVSKPASIAIIYLSFFKVFSDCPCYVFGDAFGLRLSKSGVDYQIQLTVLLKGVDVLLFEKNPDALLF